MCKIRVSVMLFSHLVNFWRLCFLVACVVLVSDSIRAQIPTAELHWLSRQAAQIGQQFDVSFHGNRLEELRSLHITDLHGNRLDLDAKAKMASQQPLRDWEESTGEFSVIAPTEMDEGLIEIRTVGRLGASNSRTLLLTKCPVLVVNDEHASMLTALPIEFGQVVNARVVPLQSKYFRLSLGPRERLRCCVYCRQIDSLTDIHLRLLDEAGHELRSSRSSGFWPAEITWENRSDNSATVFVQIHDLLGRGGPQYSYLLECGKMGSSEVSSEDSISVQGSSVGMTALNLDQLLRPSLGDSMESNQLLLPLSGVGVSFVGRSQEAESVGASQAIDIASSIGKAISTADFPVLLRGDFNQSHQLEFLATQGQLLTFDVGSARFGQLTDPALVIYKRDGEANAAQTLRWIGDSDDAAYCGTTALRLRQTDPNWVWTVPEDGQYQLRLIDNQSGSRPGDSKGFFLEARLPRPGFSLVAYRAYPVSDPATSKPWGNGLMRYGTDRLHVTILRRDGFTGPVELSVTGLPENCTCYPVIVQPGVTEGVLVIQAADGIADQTLGLSVLGKAAIANEAIEVTATPAMITAAASPTYNSVQSRRTGHLELTTVATDIAPLQVSFGDGQILEAKPESKVTILVKLRRGDGAAAECIVRPQDLPPKITLGEVKIPADQSEVSAELPIPADMPVGDYTFWGLTETKVKWQVNPQSLEREQLYLGKLQAALERISQPQSGQTTGPTTTDSDQAESLREEVEAVSKERLESLVATTTQRIEQFKTQTSPQEYTIWLPTNTVRLRVSK